jgi:hypothetical protein
MGSFSSDGAGHATLAKVRRLRHDRDGKISGSFGTVHMGSIRSDFARSMEWFATFDRLETGSCFPMFAPLAEEGFAGAALTSQRWT